MESPADTYTLNNGVKIPCLGYGTWQMPNDESGVAAVKSAVSAGYRHIDTAAVYGNEESVGRGVRECGLPRSEIFVTSKVWNSERGYRKTLAAFESSMEKLGLD